MCLVVLLQVPKDRKIKHLSPQRAYILILIDDDTPLKGGKCYSVFNTNNSLTSIHFSILSCSHVSSLGK